MVKKNIVSKFANELYDARLKLFGKENAEKWYRERAEYYKEMKKQAEGKEFRNMSEFIRWRNGRKASIVTENMENH